MRPMPAWKAVSSSNSGDFGLDALEQREREHAPAILRAALHAAVVAVADPVEPRRVAHRQRLQHHRMDEREDGRGAADAERQRQDGGGGEDARRRELAERIDQVAAKGAHAVLRRNVGSIRCASAKPGLAPPVRAPIEGPRTSISSPASTRPAHPRRARSPGPADAPAPGAGSRGCPRRWRIHPGPRTASRARDSCGWCRSRCRGRPAASWWRSSVSTTGSAWPAGMPPR